MSEQHIQISDDIEIYIDAPTEITQIERPYLMTTIVAHQSSRVLLADIYTGSIPLTIGYQFYRFNYTMRVKRIIDALDVYSQTIHHIEHNPQLYDSRLARKAIEVLRQCFYDKLK